MKAVPLPLEMVAVVEPVNENVRLPSRTLHGVPTEQPAPISSVVDELRMTARSANWLADPLPALLSSVHVFADVQPYRFAPAAAFVRKSMSPIAHAPESAVPAFRGRVAADVLKSTFLLCACKSICVWLHACCRQNEMTKNRNHIFAAHLSSLTSIERRS